MTKKAKKLIFFSLLISFFIATPLIVIYSQGYRFDFEKKKFVETGGLYFKVKPLNAEIFIDGKLKKRTSLVFGTALIENLLPKSYNVEVRKEGYHSWQKKLEVKEGWVTEAKNIILFPQKNTFSTSSKSIAEIISAERQNDSSGEKSKIALETDGSLIYQEPRNSQKIADSVKGFDFSPDLRKIVFFNDHEIWLFYLAQEIDPTIREEREKVFLNRFSKKIGKVFWLDNHYVVFNAGNKIKIMETDNRDNLNIVDLAEFKDPQIFFSQKEKRLYISSQGNLYYLEKLLP